MQVIFNIKSIGVAVNHSICGLLPALTTADTVNITITDILGNIVYSTSTVQQTYTINIAASNSWDKYYLQITVTKLGYNTYSNLITIYGYDIKTYDLTTGTFNTNNSLGFDFVLIKTDYRTNAEQDPNNVSYIPYILNLPYNSFIGLRFPFTKEFFAYKTNSAIVDVTYLDAEDSILGTDSNIHICKEEDIYIRMKTEAYVSMLANCCSSDRTLIATCLDADLTWFSTLNLLPKLSTQINSDCCDTSYLNILTTNWTKTLTDYSELSYFYIDSTLVAPFKHATLIQSIYGIGSKEKSECALQGIELLSDTIQEESYVNFTTYPISIISTPTYGYNTFFYYDWKSFKTPEHGDYKLKRTFTINAVDGTPTIGFSKIFTVKSNHWFYYERTELCNKYNFFNKSFEIINVNVYKIDDETGKVLVENFSINPCNEMTVTFNSDGVYYVEAYREVAKTYKGYSIVSFCNLEACWLKYQQEMLCCAPQDVCKTKDIYDYITLGSLITIFFSLLNEIYNFSSLSEILTETELKTLFSTSELIKRINREYCSWCKEPNHCSTLISYNLNCESC